jgi:hypothetical protein
MTTKDIWERILLIRVTPYQRRKIALLKASPEVLALLKYVYRPRVPRLAKFNYNGPFGEDDGVIFIDADYFKMLPTDHFELFQVFKELCVGKTKEFAQIITCMARKDLGLGLPPRAIEEHFPGVIQKAPFMNPTPFKERDYDAILPCHAMLIPSNSVRVIFKDNTFFMVNSVLDTNLTLPECRFSIEGYLRRADGMPLGVGKRIDVDEDDEENGVRFYAADVPDMAAPFSERLEWLRMWCIGYGVGRLRYEHVTETAQIESFCRRVDKSATYSGVIFKHDDSPYIEEKSKWWKVYYKKYMATCKVLDVYKTPQKEHVNLVVEFDGRPCKLTGNNSAAQSEEWRRNPSAIIGKTVLVSYSGLTSTGTMKNSQFRGLA